MTTNPKIVIADPGMSGFEGHHFETSLAFARAAQGEGIAPVILAGPNAAEGVHDGISYYRWFSQSFYEHPSEFRLERPHSTFPERSLLCQDLLLAVNGFGLTGGDTIFFHTSSPVQAFFASQVLTQLPADRRPQLVFLFRYDFEPSGYPYAPWFVTLVRQQIGRGSLLAPCMKFYAETAALAEFFDERFDLDIAFQPHIDCRSLRAGSRPDQPAPGRSGDVVRIAVLGEARTEKGILDLPDLIAASLSDAEIGHRVEFRVQTYMSPHHEADTALAAAVARINRLSEDGGVVTLGLLDSEDYQRELDQSEAVFAAHRPPEYKYRGSGVVIDAKLGGKPLIVREGTSFSAAEDRAFLLVYDGVESFVEIVRELVADYDACKARALELQQLTLMRSSPDVLIRDIVRRGDSIERPRVALHVAPLWKGQGSSHVFQRQIDALRAIGYSVVTLQVAQWPGPGTFGKLYGEELADAPTRGASLIWRIGRDDFSPGYLEFASGRGNSSELSFFMESLAARQPHIPASLRAFLKNWPISVAVFNYPNLLPLVDELFGNDVPPVVVETHDIRAIQYALVSGDPVRPLDLHLEYSHTARADVAVFISRPELDQFREFNASMPAFIAYPLPPKKFSAARRGERSALDRALARFRAYCLGTPAQRKALEPILTEGFDSPLFIFVGSRHEANICSMDWFFGSVASKAPGGFNLVVAGDIDRAYEFDRPGAMFLGRFEELDPLYDAADVAIAPIIAGTGFPIKVLDALSRGIPTVATGQSVAAAPFLAATLPCADDADAFAAQMQSLSFGSRQPLLDLEDRARAAFDSLQREYNYTRTWADVIETATGRPVRHSEPETAQPDAIQAVRRCKVPIGQRTQISGLAAGEIVELQIDPVAGPGGAGTMEILLSAGDIVLFHWERRSLHVRDAGSNSVLIGEGPARSLLLGKLSAEPAEIVVTVIVH